MEVNFKGEGLYNAARMSPAIFCNDELTNGQIDAHHLKKSHLHFCQMRSFSLETMQR